jgi:hypothetical protein
MKARHWLAAGVVLLCVGMFVMPVAAYLAGANLAGEYQGPRGLASYMGAIYADAARGRLPALLLLCGPLLAVAIWPLRAWILRRWAPHSEITNP